MLVSVRYGYCVFFFSSRRRHTRCSRDWSSDVLFRSLWRYIARVFDLVVFVGRLRDGRRCVQEIAELRDVDANGRYEICSVFTSEPTTGRHGIEVEFAAVPDYRPGARLIRKPGLQGMRGMA